MLIFFSKFPACSGQYPPVWYICFGSFWANATNEAEQLCAKSLSRNTSWFQWIDSAAFGRVCVCVLWFWIPWLQYLLKKTNNILWFLFYLRLTRGPGNLLCQDLQALPALCAGESLSQPLFNQDLSGMWPEAFEQGQVLSPLVQYRKWYVSVTTRLSRLGRWFSQ